MPDCLICSTSLPASGLRAVDRLHGIAGEHSVVRCPECGAGRTLPAADPAALARFYPSGYGPYEPASRPLERWISRAIRGWQGYRARRTFPLVAMASLPPGRGLDIGCGRGDLAAGFVARGWEMTGIEPSETAVEAARRQGVDARVGVLGTVDLPDEAFDAAVFQHSLEHTEEPLDDLRRVHRALKPGGIVCISVPNFGGWQARRFGSRWYHLDVPRHRAHFTAEALERALTDTGFTDVRLSTSTTPVGLPASIQYRVAGRCLFPDGLRLRVAAGLCALAQPVAALLDRAGGGGDVVHGVAVKPQP